MSQLPNDYEALYQQTLQNQQSTEDYIVENDLVSTYTKKLINTTRSADEKLAILEKSRLQKELDVTGYLQGSIESMSDADSGFFTDINGQRQAFRFADLNPIDAIDKEEARLASDYKSRLQPAMVASLTGKPVDQLTEQDFVNVANYQYEQIQGSLSDKDYQFNPYNPEQLYNAPAQEQSQIPFAYKVVGKDAYDRLLIEAINPETGRQVTFDMSTNPYLNSSFDIYKSIDSKKNRTRLDQYQVKHNEQAQRIADAFDSDGRISESLDIAQSTAYQTAARLLQYGPDFLVDSEKWARIANAETGQALADAWAGVKTSTRRDFAKGMTEASDAWNNGDYVDAILGWGSQMDRLFAESATQMGLMIAGTAIVAGATAATGGGALAGGATLAARVGGAFLGASLAGVDKTLSTIEEYKVNNNGEMMDAGQIAQAFAMNTATLIPEAFLIGVNFSSFLPKSVASKFGANLVSGAVLSRGKTVATSILGEAGQEGLEGAVERYLAQDQKNPKSFMDYLLSSDTAKEAVIGGMMGGALSGIGASVTAPFAIRSDIKTVNKIEVDREYDATRTNTGSENVDTSLSARILERLPNITLRNPADMVGLKKVTGVLNDMLAAKNLSIDTVEAINQKKAELISASVLELDTRDTANRDSLLKALGVSKEEVFKEQVFYSDLNASRQLQRDGKRISDEHKATVKEELLNVASKLGISKDQAQKTIALVTEDVRYGSRGYNTYAAQINTITSLLNSNKVTKEEKAKLESNLRDYTDHLARLYSNQFSKLAQFAEHAERIASGTVRKSKFTYESGEGGFNLIGEHLANNTYESGYSAYGLVQSIEQDLKEMTEIVKSLPKNIQDQLNLQTEVAQSNLQRFKDAATNIRSGIKQKVKEKSKSDITNRDLLAKLRTISKGMTNKAKKTQFVNEIRNASEEQKDAIKAEIIASKFSEDTKKELLKTLEDINTLDATTEVESRDIEVRNKSNLEVAKELKAEITEDTINDISSYDEAEELLNRIQRVATPITAVDKELAQQLRELYSKTYAKQKEFLAAKVEEMSTKDFAVNTILDGEINYSATFAPYGWNSKTQGIFNLRDEVKVSKTLGSTFAVFGIQQADKSYVARVMAKMKPIFLTLNRTEEGSPIGNQMSYFTKSKGKIGGMWNNAPHLRLLYNFITQEQDSSLGRNDIRFEANEAVAAVVDLSLKEFFSSMNVKDVFNPKTRYDLGKLYGINEATMTDEEYQQLKAVVKQYGIPEVILADRLGELILDNLGITANKNGTVGFYEKTTTGMGLFALSYAQELGYVSKEHFDPKLWTQEHSGREHVLRNKIPHIKFDYTKTNAIRAEFLGRRKADGKIDDTHSLKKKYILTDRVDSKPRTVPADLPRDMKIKGTRNLIDIPAFTKKVMNKLWKTPYVVNLELAELVAQNKEAIKARLGYRNDIENSGLAFDERESFEGINSSIDLEIEHLLEAAAYQQAYGNKWYFNWFMSKNGRLFMDSNTLNPQSGKAIQRFLALPEKMYRDFDVNNEAHIKSMYFAIAQAFDSVLTDAQIEQIGKAVVEQDTKAMLNDIIHMDEKAFLKKYESTGIKVIENFGHALNVLQHINKMKEANGKPFKTWLAVENDSTTSGYFIRFLQFPDPSVVDSFGEKVGIIREDSKTDQTEIHNLKRTKGFLDIYKTMAKNMSELLPKSEGDIRSFYDQAKKLRLDTGTLLTTFKLMNDALPKPDADGNVNSALRKLLKSPAMTFGYTAGKKSISDNLAREIMSEFIHIYMDVKKAESLEAYLSTVKESEKAKVTAVYNTLEHIAKYHRGDLYKSLSTDSVANIKLNVGKTFITLDRYFNEVLAPTYGEAVWSSLEKSFAPYIEYNNSMNQMFVHMFQMFNTELEKKMNTLRQEYPFGIPKIKEQEAIESLFDIFPAMRLAYSNSIEEGMLLMNTEKIRDDNTNVISPITKNGQVDRTTSYANVHKFVNAGKAGAVLPIHFVDGMGMAMVLDKFSNIVPVHDAIVMSALDNQAITQEYNKVMTLLCKEESYDVYGTLVDRYIEVVQKFNEMNNSDNSVFAQQMEDAYGTKSDMTTEQFIEHILELNARNQANRKNFYSSSLYISNMDGIEGSGLVVHPTDTLQDKAFKDAINSFKGWSDPNKYRTDNDIRQTLQEAGVSVEGRIKLFDDLQQLAKDLGNKVENSEHLNYLKDLISRVNPKHLTDIVVEYSTSQDYTVGMLEKDTVTIGFDSKAGELDPVTRLSPFSHKSPAEVYAHEMIHAGLRLGFANKDTFKLNKEIQQLMKLQKAAMDIVTWEDFMPTTYDSKLQSVYEQNAKEIWNYIFNNPNVTELQGLHEFTAYGLTNEKMMNKLKEHKVVLKSNDGQAKLLDKLVALAKSILDVVFGNEKFSTTFDLAHEILKGNIPIRYKRTMFQELERLTNKINYANGKAGEKLFHHPMKAIESLFGIVGKIRIKGNEIISPKIKYVMNIADNLGLAQGWYADINGSWFDSAKLLANLFVLSPFSQSRRQALNVWLREVAQLSQQGVIQTILREVQTPDLQTSRLMIISTLTRTVDQTSKGLESTVYADLSEKFGKKALTDEETTALTRAALFTDLSSLLENDNIEDIKKILSDDNYLSSEIDKLVESLDNTGHGTWYRNQALGLAYYMTTGVGNEAQNLNARNIAEGRLTGKIITTNDKIVSEIDKLATLYAVQLTETTDRQLLANLSSKGLENFLITHKNFVKETINGIETTDMDGNKVTVNMVEDIHAIKGYTKQLLDTSVDLKVDMLKNEKELTKAGYKRIKNLGTNEITGVSDLALYKRTYATPNRRDGAGFILTGANTIGTTLKESAYQTYENIDPNASLEDVKKLQEVYYNNAVKVSRQLMGLMQNGEVTIEKIKELSKGYTPIVSPKGGVADFRITMSYNTKIEHLGMNLNGLNLLSKMYATQNTKLHASTRNKVLVNFLKDDMRINMNTVSKQDLEGHKYILMTKNTDNQFLKDAWSFIPKELMTEIKKGDFYVREDWLQDLFGVPSTSIVKNKFVDRHSATIVKRALTVGEYILKHIAYMAKQNIIIRVPAVLAGNIMSNLNLSIANGSNPITVTKKTIDNARSIRDYIDNKKELNRIEFRQRLGTASEKELSQINWYKAKLEHNPVHPLMQKGMYQAIVEDINPDELESIGKINQFFKNNKLTKKIPSPIRWFARQLYMTEGTAYFDFMFQATQYSDFVSRATEYQLRMAKAPEKYKTVTEDGVKKQILNDDYIKYEEAVTIDIWNAFINYDKPQSSMEQYLNDIGLIMFTKFAKRIQHQITKGIVDNPMGVMMFMLAQSAIVNTEDIYEQNIFNKTWSALIHNPIDNFTNAITPMPLQYYFGMRNLGL